jgi:hypothetical protein
MSAVSDNPTLKIDCRANTGKNPSSEACVLVAPMAASEARPKED